MLNPSHVDRHRSRELASDVAGVLRRLEQGEDVIVTVNGRPVAKLIPPPDDRRSALPRAEFLQRLAQADPGLRDDLRALSDTTTDDCRPGD